LNKLEITLDLAGVTVAALLRKHHPDRSWSAVRKLVAGRRVRVNGDQCLDPARRLKAGDTVEVLDQPLPKLPAREDIVIRHLDRHVVVVEKPAGIPTVRHPAEREWPAQRKALVPTLDDLVLGQILQKEKPAQKGKRPRLRIVHRLDKETSGLLVFARTVEAERGLGSQFKKHTVIRPSCTARFRPSELRAGWCAIEGMAGAAALCFLESAKRPSRMWRSWKLCRNIRCLAVGWKPAGPIRFAFTFPSWAIRCAGTRCIAAGSVMRCLRTRAAHRAWPSTPRSSASSIRSREKPCSGRCRYLQICRIACSDCGPSEVSVQIKWTDRDPETGERRFLCADRFAGKWRFRCKLTRRGPWNGDLEPTRIMWETVLDNLRRRYRRREGVSDEDIEQVERILKELPEEEDQSG